MGQPTDRNKVKNSKVSQFAGSEYVLSPPSDQGCQIFLGTAYQNGKNVPN
jgi:hypothetical protein